MNFINMYPSTSFYVTFFLLNNTSKTMNKIARMKTMVKYVMDIILINLPLSENTVKVLKKLEAEELVQYSSLALSEHNCRQKCSRSNGTHSQLRMHILYWMNYHSVQFLGTMKILSTYSCPRTGKPHQKHPQSQKKSTTQTAPSAQSTKNTSRKHITNNNNHINTNKKHQQQYQQHQHH